MAMAAMCLIRIRYTRLFIHLVSGDLAVGAKGGRKSSGRCSHRVVDLGKSTFVTGLVLEVLDQFKSSMVMPIALGHWSLEAREAGSSIGAVPAARRQLASAAVVVVR
jgi:hypothetical protein